MSKADITQLATQLLERFKQSESSRFIVAIAGAPGSGKSTLCDSLLTEISNLHPEIYPVILPMDGFHYDNNILDVNGWRSRKGAHFTFDREGYINALDRIRQNKGEVAVPIFDREMDLARAGATLIEKRNRLILTEGNYLMLKDQPWARIRDYVDLGVFLQVEMPVLESRLVRRWADLGFSQSEAKNRAEQNDLVNARYMLENSVEADLVVSC